MAHTYTKRPSGTPPTTNAERIRRYRERQKEKGRVNIMIYLDRETIEGLKPYQKPGECPAACIERLLRECFAT
jgi:hypothetical protein